MCLEIRQMPFHVCGTTLHNVLRKPNVNPQHLLYSLHFEWKNTVESSGKWRVNNTPKVAYIWLIWGASWLAISSTHWWQRKPLLTQKATSEIKCRTVLFVISLAWFYGEPHLGKYKARGRGERMEERRHEECSVFLLHYWGWVLGSLRHVGILNHLHPANVSSHLMLLPSASFLHFSMESPPPHFYISRSLSSIIVGNEGSFPKPFRKTILVRSEPDGNG